MLSNDTSLSIANAAAQKSDYRVMLRFFLVAFGVAILALSAKIQVPFWPVPMTLQTLAMMGIAAAYGSRLGVATVIAYLMAGYAGASVFAGPIAGPAYFAGPTAGFLAGFVAIAMIVGAAADRGWGNSPLKLFATMLVADVVCFAIGFAWLGFMFVSANTGNTLGAETAFNVGVKPYILSDIVKIALAALMVPAIGKLLRR